MQMIKLKDLLYEKKLTSDDIKVGDAYLKKTRQGKIVSMVYEKKYNGGVITVEYDFKPSYGNPMLWVSDHQDPPNQLIAGVEIKKSKSHLR